MYVDIANMTLKEVNKVCSSLSNARMDTYISKVGNNAFLYTSDRQKFRKHAPRTRWALSEI
jgi:hypothetical protein